MEKKKKWAAGLTAAAAIGAGTLIFSPSDKKLGAPLGGVQILNAEGKPIPLEQVTTGDIKQFLLGQLDLAITGIAPIWNERTEWHAPPFFDAEGGGNFAEVYRNNIEAATEEILEGKYGKALGDIRDALAITPTVKIDAAHFEGSADVKAHKAAIERALAPLITAEKVLNWLVLSNGKSQAVAEPSSGAGL